MPVAWGHLSISNPIWGLHTLSIKLKNNPFIPSGQECEMAADRSIDPSHPTELKPT